MERLDIEGCWQILTENVRKGLSQEVYQTLGLITNKNLYLTDRFRIKIVYNYYTHDHMSGRGPAVEIRVIISKVLPSIFNTIFF